MLILNHARLRCVVGRECGRYCGGYIPATLAFIPVTTEDLRQTILADLRDESMKLKL